MLRKVTNFIKTKKFLALVAIVILSFFLVSRKNADKIESIEVKKGSVADELVLTGSINAGGYAKLSFQSSGELADVYITEGESVKKGQILAKLDTTILYQTYLQTESDLRYYRAVVDTIYDQVKGHDKDESFTQKETRTQAEVNRDNAYRTYVAAQKNLANATLRAPFDGIITGVTHPFEGINTSLTESQIEIVNPETIYFDVSADQLEISKISIGQKVIVTLDSYSDIEYEGRASYLGLTPKPGETSTTYKIKVDFLETDKSKLRLGMTGDAKLILREKENVLFVPPRFVGSDTTGKYVNLGKPGNKIYIETGIESEDKIEIRGNINEGDVVYD